MGSKTLSNYHEPVINGLDAGVVFANQLVENIYQAEIETGGKGCTQKYSNDTTGAQIRVVRPLPLPIKARELGASINGGNFSSFNYQPGSNAYGLDVITTIDDIVDIPDVSVDMIPVEIAQANIRNISDKVVLNINALKIAARFYTCFSAEQVDSTKAYVVSYNSATDNLLKKVIETNGKLNKGDKDNGVSAFPVNDRLGIVSPDYYAEFISLLGAGTMGANKAYDILKQGAIDAESGSPVLLDNGFIGIMNGIPFHFASDLVFETATEYLGFPGNVFEDVICHVASAHGNLFGLASGNNLETIKCPIGQGLRLLPKYRMGASCIMPKAVSWLVKDFVNPYGLKAIFTSGITWCYKAPGSRNELVCEVKNGTATTKFDLSCATKDGTAFKPVGALLVNDECYSVGEFISAYNDTSKKHATFTASDFPGTDKVLTGVTTGDSVTMLVIDEDGTCAISPVITAQ